MTGDLGAGGVQRLNRLGLTALSDEQGLALFDARRWRPTRRCWCRRPGPGALQAQARLGTLPTLLRGLRADAGTRRAPRGRRLARRSASPRCRRTERADTLLDLVREQVAAVLGHDAPRRSTPSAPSRTWASTR